MVYKIHIFTSFSIFLLFFLKKVVRFGGWLSGFFYLFSKSHVLNSVQDFCGNITQMLNQSYDSMFIWCKSIEKQLRNDTFNVVEICNWENSEQAVAFIHGRLLSIKQFVTGHGLKVMFVRIPSMSLVQYASSQNPNCSP